MVYLFQDAPPARGKHLFSQFPARPCFRVILDLITQEPSAAQIRNHANDRELAILAKFGPCTDRDLAAATQSVKESPLGFYLGSCLPVCKKAELEY